MRHINRFHIKKLHWFKHTSRESVFWNSGRGLQHYIRIEDTSFVRSSFISSSCILSIT